MTDCACLKGYLDFYFNPISSDKAIYVDASDWMTGERFKADKEYVLNLKNIVTGYELTVDIVGRNGQVIENKDASFSGGIYLFYVYNCDTPYYRYGVSFYDVLKVRDELILNHWEEEKEVVIELWARMTRLETKVNYYKTEQDEAELINEYNELVEFVEQLKCKL